MGLRRWEISKWYSIIMGCLYQTEGLMLIFAEWLVFQGGKERENILEGKTCYEPNEDQCTWPEQMLKLKSRTLGMQWWGQLCWTEILWKQPRFLNVKKSVRRGEPCVEDYLIVIIILTFQAEDPKWTEMQWLCLQGAARRYNNNSENLLSSSLFLFQGAPLPS